MIVRAAAGISYRHQYGGTACRHGGGRLRWSAWLPGSLGWVWSPGPARCCWLRQPPLSRCYLVIGTLMTWWISAKPGTSWPCWPAHGHRVDLHECPGDHAGVVLTEFDPVQGLCRPATAPHAVQAGHPRRPHAARRCGRQRLTSARRRARLKG